MGITMKKQTKRRDRRGEEEEEEEEEEMSWNGFGETPLLLDVVQTPATSVLCGICIAFWAVISIKRYDYDTVGLNYTSKMKMKS